MSTPRLRRLEADYQQLLTAFSGHPHLRLEPIGIFPPERYRVVYQVPGLWLDRETNRIRPAGQHVVDIVLPAGYPREKPYCTTVQPVFHPNFGAYICIADFWSPAQTLVDVVVEIGDLIQYKLFNTRSPLNAVAAQWVNDHLSDVPVGHLDLGPQEPEVRLKETSDF
jgi:Ubiquitin-conjugating enzyme